MENSTAIKMFNETVKYSNDVIFVKPVCDFFGIEYDNQCRIIKKDVILKTSAGKFPSMLLFGDERARVTLSKTGFIRWIQLINPQIVQVSLRDDLINYQILIFEYLLGNIQSEDKVKLMYQRVKKLKRLKGIINQEIKRCEGVVQNYLNTKFVQTKIDLK